MEKGEEERPFLERETGAFGEKEENGEKEEEEEEKEEGRTNR